MMFEKVTVTGRSHPPLWSCDNGLKEAQPPGTCIFGDVVQQQRVLGEPLHLDGDDVFQLEPATQSVRLGLLKTEKIHPGGE